MNAGKSCDGMEDYYSVLFNKGCRSVPGSFDGVAEGNFSWGTLT